MGRGKGTYRAEDGSKKMVQKIDETMQIPSETEEGGGGRSPTRPITAVPIGVGDGVEGGV